MHNSYPGQVNLPVAQGLYDPANEHDACGVAFVVDMNGQKSHEMVQNGLKCLFNLDHRGATGAEANVGDGAGILIQIPHEYFTSVCEFKLPAPGYYAAGMAFLPSENTAAAAAAIEQIVESEGLHVIGWREVPTDPSTLGSFAVDAMPVFRTLFMGDPTDEPIHSLELERRSFIIRKRIEHETRPSTYFPSLSARTFVYKGMLTCEQLPQFYPDLNDERLKSSMALVHSRFSTNTFPSWPLAHPYRLIAHNGEINTVEGNRNWMQARE
ncbi:MAG: glutamate synthase subunit alpha, partial [Actinobacteria bacterium]|nr:glutamate synthase subunit alpha [Actinomycetota bacterium]